jgi:hypothetical protein
MLRSGGAWVRRQRRAPMLIVGTDAEMQRAVLAVVLREHPILLTFPALAAELFENPNGLVAGIALARAVRDLVTEELLYSNGVFVLPSRPALHLKRLGQRDWRQPSWR